MIINKPKKNAGNRHILVIPSEEFQPPESHQAGIFQLHQCLALKNAGYQVGVISIKLEYSLPMLLKEIVFRLVGKPARKKLATYRLLDLPLLLYNKLFRLARFISKEAVHGIPTLRIAGFYHGRPNERTDYKRWVHAGLKAYQAYVDLHGKPDLIHAHNSNPAGILAQRLSDTHNIPFVLTEHSSYFHRRLIPPSLITPLRKVLDNASVVGVVSPRLAEDLQEHVGLPADRCQWMPNVIDPEFTEATSAAIAPSDTFHLLSIGDLIPLKAHAELIEAFHFSMRGNNAHLIIAGDGPEDHSLQRRILDLGLGKQIKLVGRLGRRSVRDAIDRCDCLVLPSHYETFGVVLIEALVRGKPVIAADCGGPSCIVNKQNGILFPPKNISALAKALDHMSRFHDIYDSDAIRRDAIERFGQKRLVSDLTSAYAKAFDHSNHLKAA
jgi:glycosyltransferase involved in cell wall biosynthesis